MESYGKGCGSLFDNETERLNEGLGVRSEEWALSEVTN
jgi:hypothetical protein